MKYTVSLTLLLVSLWLLLSGHYQPLMLTFGVASVLFSVFLARRMGIVDAQSQPLHMFVALPRYALILAYKIVLSNVEVAACVLGLRKVKPKLTVLTFPSQDDLHKVIYANSITLTPGTATVHIEDNKVIVHTLNAQSAKDLEQGDMVSFMPFDTKVSQ